MGLGLINWRKGYLETLKIVSIFSCQTVSVALLAPESATEKSSLVWDRKKKDMRNYGKVRKYLKLEVLAFGSRSKYEYRSKKIMINWIQLLKWVQKPEILERILICKLQEFWAEFEWFLQTLPCFRVVWLKLENTNELGENHERRSCTFSDWNCWKFETESTQKFSQLQSVLSLSFQVLYDQWRKEIRQKILV